MPQNYLNTIRGEYKLDNGFSRAVADDLIYNSGLTYTIPVFTIRLSWVLALSRTYQVFHTMVFFLLERRVCKLSDPNALFEYNPYIGRMLRHILGA